MVKERRYHFWTLLFVFIYAAGAGTASAADPDKVSFTLEGCKKENLPLGYDLEGNDFLCDVGMGVNAYTTGNLGKGWNELDLVPWRVTTDAGNAAPATQTYTVAFTVDGIEAGKPGYDVITSPKLNASSHASCALSAAEEQSELTPGVGGTDTSYYLLLTITQAKNTKCFIDGQARLALGSHLFPGSSLHFNLLNESLTTAGIGNKDVSIPVKEILPQEIKKDMKAVQDTDFAWNVTKGPNPAMIDFGNTCRADASFSSEVAIRVEWTLLPGDPGMVMVMTNIYATNPASRSIQVEVTDEIFGTIGGIEMSLDEHTCDPVVVPANTTQLVCTHTTSEDETVTGLRDVATATYTDFVTGVPVPGQTTAEASAPVEPGMQTNTLATIEDVESITGDGLTFSVDGTDPAGVAGTFEGGYVLGTAGVGPVTWSSGEQEDSGFARFFKTVYLDGPRNTSGKLSDTATLQGSDGFPAEASADVTLLASAEVSLTIRKTMPDILQGDETVKVSFKVKGPNNFEEDVEIEFAAGETEKTTTLGDLEPGLYEVEETVPFGFETSSDNPQIVDITLPLCAGEASFENVLKADDAAIAKVQKVTYPAGEEAGWKMTLAGPGGPEELETSGAGLHTFDLILQEGSYTITETLKSGWDKTGESGDCSFTVDYPADFGKVFACTFENTQKGKIIVKKLTDPAAAEGTFEFTGALSGSIGDGEMLMEDVVPGTYAVFESDPTPEFDLVSIECSDEGETGGSTHKLSYRKANFNVQPGEEVTCTFTNRKRAMVDLLKLTNGAESASTEWRFTLKGPGVDETDKTPPALLDFGGVKLIPGEVHTICETGIPPSWTLSWKLGEQILPFVGAKTGNPLEIYDPSYGVPEASNDTRCVDFEPEAGETLHFEVDNQSPGGEPRTIGYWKNWNLCSGGNQAQTALKNGGAAAGFYLLDDLLPQTLGTFNVTICADGKSILNKSSIDDGKKRASDAAYGMAAQLLAAKLNFAALAESCQAAQNAATAADALLTTLGFNGKGEYLPSKPKAPFTLAQRNLALTLAGTLDAYNNGALCP